MSNEPNPGFSNQAGGLNPAGMYCYPIRFGGSTKEKLVCKYIPYPYSAGGNSYQGENPGDLENK